jgi:prefoldin subunit 5
MTADPTSDLAAQIERLERELKELKSRLAALERLMKSAAEHPSDRRVVREKAVFDWQG